MKLGTENSKKTIGASALFLVAIMLFIRMLSGSSSQPVPAAPPATGTTTPPPARAAKRNVNRRNGHAEKPVEAVTPSLDPRLRLDALKESEDTSYDGKGRNIFMATEEPSAVAIPKAVAPGLTKAAQNNPPPPPPRDIYHAPPINLKFFGFASGPDHKRVFLAQGDDIFVAGEGDIVQRRYKIVKINSNNIEVLDVLSNHNQTIPLTAG